MIHVAAGTKIRSGSEAMSLRLHAMWLSRYGHDEAIGMRRRAAAEALIVGDLGEIDSIGRTQWWLRTILRGMWQGHVHVRMRVGSSRRPKRIATGGSSEAGWPQEGLAGALWDGGSSC